MKKPLQPHLLKRVPPACKGERTMKWRGRPPIGGQDSDRVSHRCFAPYTLLPLRGISPQGETRNLRRKTESHILHVPLRHSPFGGWRHHLSPSMRGHYKAPLCCELLTKRGLAVLYCPTAPRGEGGAVRHQRGKSHRRWLITRMLIMLYDTESQSRNADFILIARKGDTITLGPAGPVKLKNLPAARPVNPKNLSPCPLSEANTTCRRQAATTLGPKARQPSHRRCVQSP